MTVQNKHELERTRQKLRDLEARYLAASKKQVVNAEVQAATLTSLRRLINQLKEEIARFESHQEVPN